MLTSRWSGRPPDPVHSSGYGCSVQFGINLISATPGFGPIPYLVVSDVEVARNDLIAGAWR